MGIFGSIKSVYKKSEAAVVAENLLVMQANSGVLELDPGKLASDLVEAVWNTKPDVFDGKFGQRPHKIIVAASALAHGIEAFDADDFNRNALILSLGTILSEMEKNRRLYPLNSLDHQLLDESISVYSAVATDFLGSAVTAGEGDSSQSNEESGWEGWFKVFREEAGKWNPELEVNEEGNSVIDFMEHEPLKRACRDGVDPRTLARDFAKQFDISRFGV